MMYAICDKLYAVCYMPCEWMKCFMFKIAFVTLTQSCNFFNKNSFNTLVKPYDQQYRMINVD